MKIVICTIKSWNIANAYKLRKRNVSIFILTAKKELTLAKIKKINPEYIFFPHWSWLIPEEIYKKFKCVIFHMTDVPFGRGGTPLQNLIERGVRYTKISAIKAIGELDAGPVYLKRNLTLTGSAEKIYRRASHIVFSNMIPLIIDKNLVPVPQKGRVVMFKRRHPRNSRLPKRVKALDGIYDFIRMLDAEGYPKAFIDYGDIHIEFSSAYRSDGMVIAKACIRKKKNLV